MSQVVFDERMVAATRSFSPSSRKPGLVMQDWLQHWPSLNVVAPRMVARKHLAQAHDPEYVDGVLDCSIPNGFGNTDPDVARSLPWTVGAMVTAAVLALRETTTYCAPVSGFHHAYWSRGGGYCTFNGLMVAALHVLKQNLADQVFILDCDFHYGDGTEDILQHVQPGQGPVHRLTRRIHHFTAGEHFGRGASSAEFLGWVGDAMFSIKRHPADMRRKLVLYQAGADQHVDDPLGGLLTTGELQRRDNIVFRYINAYGIPCAWNLAGGYQQEPDGSIPKVLEIHRNTMNESLSA
ncbi:MAG: hypothetical protein J0L58_20780 [Burkholderiales bacterium]|nr:hypothetical protein [Burkholderiales bacterium]